MKTISAREFDRLLRLGKVNIVGTTPHVIDKGKSSRVKVEPECGATIKTERYSGGHRWYCPNCDQGSVGNIRSIQYINSKPPKDLICHRPGRY